MKKLSLCLLCMLLLFSFMPASIARAAESPDSRKYLTDTSYAFLPDEAERAERALADASRDGLVYAVYFENDSGYRPEDMGRHAEALFENQYPGKEGFFLLVNLGIRECRVYVSEEVARTLSVKGQNKITRAVMSELSAFRYGEAVDTFISRSQDEWEEAEAAAAKGKNIPLRIVVSCVLAVALGSGVALILRRNMNTVRFQRDAVAYQTGNLKITKSKDVFLYSHVSKIRVSNNDTSRSSSRTSGRGRTTGGRF